MNTRLQRVAHLFFYGNYFYGVCAVVVRIGLRKTIFFVVFPLTILGVLTFLSYALVHQFSLLKMILIMIPFFLLIIVA